jgi:Raf kinase inhibitor-like YbhB/YbcL family protein
MHGLRLSAALLFTSSVFLVHCSGDDAPGGANGAGTSSTMGGSTSVAGKGGSTNAAGVSGSVAGGPMTGGSAGQGGSGGTAGPGGSGTGLGGAGAGGAGGAAGGAGRGTAGTSGSGMAGSGTAGTGTSTGGMSGAGGTVGNGSGGAPAGAGGRAAGGTGTGGTSGGSMMLTSSVLTEGGMFAENNTCNGDDKSPDLTWTAGPAGTMSYAVVLLDTSLTPPLNHWVIWDIPANVTGLPAGLETTAMPSVPPGAKQKAFQGNGYKGPCPPSGDHLYTFTVYALPVATLSGAMTSEQTAALAMDVMNAGPLSSASLSGHSLGGT